MKSTENTNSSNCLSLSVLVAIYNVEKFLDSCLQSLKNQTVTNVEFILVDDGSTDKSLKICQKYLQNDNRFKLITHTSNKGLMLARQTAIQEARGRWSIFLDGDDFLSSNRSLEILLNLAEHYCTDILRFNIDLTGGSKTEQFDFKRWRMDFVGKLDTPGNILKYCYQEKKYSWTLWDKLYRTSVLKQVCPHIPNEHLVCAEDAFLYFLISYYSTTFSSIDTEGLYTYRIGSGVSTGEVSTEKFEKYAKERAIISWLSEFLTEEKQLEKYGAILHALDQSLFAALEWRFSRLNSQQKVKGIPSILKWSSIPDVVNLLYKEYQSNPVELAEALSGNSFLQVTKKNIQTIGIFYHRIFNGGVERVVSLLIPIFIKEGYKVVLFVEKESLSDEYEIPCNVTKILIPQTYESDRAKVLFEQLQKHRIDVFLHQAGSSRNLPFDIVLIKLLGVPVVVTRHELTTQDILIDEVGVSRYPHIYKLVDKLTVLSRMEEQFYKNFSIPVEYVPNPITIIPTKYTRKTNNSTSKNLIWVARLEQNQKNYIDALEIMKRVSSSAPEIQSYILGGEETPGAEAFIKAFIQENGLTERIHFVGYTRNPEKYYQNAYVCLCTSSFESWSMTILESKLYGVPLVTYEMPYLEILQNKRGFLSVKQGDIKGAVSAILTLSQNSALHKKLSNEAKDSIYQFFGNIDLGKRWSEIINSTLVSSSKVQTEISFYNQMFWDITFEFYKKSLQRRQHPSPQIVYLNKELSYDEKIKISRYDNIVHIAKRILPDGSKRKTCIKALLKPFYGLIKITNKFF